MPTNEKRNRLQYAVYWPVVGVNEFGKLTVGDPIELRVRWENLIRDASRDTNTKNYPRVEIHDYDAKAIVDRDLDEQGRLWLGKLSEWYGTGSGAYEEDVMEIAQFSKIPNTKNRGIRRIAHLRFYKNLPA